MSEMVSISPSSAPLACRPESRRLTSPRTPWTMKCRPSTWAPSDRVTSRATADGTARTMRRARSPISASSCARVTPSGSLSRARRDSKSVVAPVRAAAAASAIPHAPPPITPTTGRTMRGPYSAKRPRRDQERHAIRPRRPRRPRRLPVGSRHFTGSCEGTPVLPYSGSRRIRARCSHALIECWT